MINSAEVNGSESHLPEAFLVDCREMVESNYLYWLNHFPQANGYIPAGEGSSSSEGQSYGLIRALYANDMGLFNRIWGYTRQVHQRFTEFNPKLMRSRNDTRHLISWRVRGDGFVEWSSATDGDVLIAYALLRAYEKWGKPYYRNEALKIIPDIWRWQVEDQFKTLILVGSARVNAPFWAGDQRECSAPYFMPFALRKFAEVDPQRPWLKLLNDQYALIDGSTQLSKWGLPTEFFSVKTKDGVAVPKRLGHQAADFTFSTGRLLGWLAWDLALNQDPVSQAYLTKWSKALLQEISYQRPLIGRYKLNGTAEGTPSAGLTAQALAAAYLTGQTEQARYIHFKHLRPLFKGERYFQKEFGYFMQDVPWFSLLACLPKLL